MTIYIYVKYVYIYIYIYDIFIDYIQRILFNILQHLYLHIMFNPMCPGLEATPSWAAAAAAARAPEVGLEAKWDILIPNSKRSITSHKYQ